MRDEKYKIIDADAWCHAWRTPKVLASAKALEFHKNKLNNEKFIFQILSLVKLKANFI